MQHPFQVLRAEYDRFLSVMKVTRRKVVDQVAARLIKPAIMDHHLAVQEKTGVPAVLLATLFEREASSDFSKALGQGDRWDRRSVNVPRGKGPFANWKAAAIYYVGYDHLNDNSAPWSMTYACWKGEAWNGFGPRGHGRPTGYLWAGTTIYDPPRGPGGKYVSDGVWSGSTVDQQLGIVPVMQKMIELNPALAFGEKLELVDHAGESDEIQVEPVPLGVGGGEHDARWIQHALNVTGQKPLLREDGNYGRQTRAAVRHFQQNNNLATDGLAGEETIGKLLEIMKGL